MLILGLESSCDETGVALVAFDPGSPGLPQLRAQALHTQIDMHKAYGGVVPELASRDHIRRVVPLVRQVMEEGGRALADLDVVADTAGPGLAGALLVGAGAAQALALALGKPVLPVHHLEGHLLSPFLSADPPAFPFVALLVSGGHTQLMHVQGVGQYALLGESIDDAAGEAFDKCAKLIGLDYPGGAALSRLAQQGRPEAYAFPRPLLHSGDLDFSFAGLKTSVATQVQRLQAAQHGGVPGLSDVQRADVAASAQAAIVDVLVRKSLSALKRTGLRRLVVAGGVGANRELRAQLDAACARMQARVHYPELPLCTDNGAMIAMAAAMRLQAGIQQPAAAGAFEVMPRWPFAVAASA
ncbi:MAG: tRNA (adenosine(37)-N6)-threonylcarbamoyltransferase complex transferase subunit TsaD [Betaproteobacteria bacterium]